MNGSLCTPDLSLPAVPPLAGRTVHPHDTAVQLDAWKIGAGTFTVMAGPCAVEDDLQMQSTAHYVKECGGHILRGGAFKPRTSPYSFRGLGAEGLRLLRDAGRKVHLPVITEVMDTRQVELVAENADILQIGSRNMSNFDLLVEAGQSGKPIMLKRGMQATLEEWLAAAEYILKTGNSKVVLCERGIRTHERAYRNTLDLNAVPMLKKLTHLPVIVDPSHGTGHRWMVAPMACAAVAAGADGIMVETHYQPEQARCDGHQSLPPDDFKQMMKRLQEIVRAFGKKMHRPTVEFC